MSFSNKKSFYYFNPTQSNFNRLNTFNEKINKKDLANMFKRQKITFVWKNVELELVNSLRRTIIANISTICIDNVEFFERSSQSETNETNEFYLYTKKRPVQNNEQIKLRLELLPIKQDIIGVIIQDLINKMSIIKLYKSSDKRIYIVDKSVNLPSNFELIENPDENDLRKTVFDNLVIEFDVIHSTEKGTSKTFIQNFTENIWCDITSNYFKVHLDTYDELLNVVKSDKLVYDNDLIFDDTYLITRIKRGQYLKFKAYLNDGVGAINSKYTPVCSVSYLPIPKPYLDDIDGNIDNLNNIHWSLEQNIPENPKNFLITLQSLEYEQPENIFIYGLVKLNDILHHYINIFTNMNNYIKEYIKDNGNPINNDRSTMSLTERMKQEEFNYFIEFMDGREIRFILLDKYYSGYTFCNWFQSELLSNSNIEFCGYQNPHPKIKEINMYIRFKSNIDDYIQILIDIINNMKIKISEYQSEFKIFNI